MFKENKNNLNTNMRKSHVCQRLVRIGWSKLFMGSTFQAVLMNMYWMFLALSPVCETGPWFSCCTCIVGLCKWMKVFQPNWVMCFPAPDSVPVRHRDHEGRLSGRRANQTQPHADDVHQRTTGQEKHHDLNGRHSFHRNLTWCGFTCVHSVFISILQFFLQHIMSMSLLKVILESLGFSQWILMSNSIKEIIYLQIDKGAFVHVR